MAKRKFGDKQGNQSGGNQGGGNEGYGGYRPTGGTTNDRIPAALREFGQKAAELAQNPIARSVIAAGLVTAAAALTANQKVRDTAKKAARDAADTTEEAAANATRLGEALVTAATDTFRRMFNVDEASSGSSSGSGSSGGGASEEPLSTPRKTRARKTAPEDTPARGRKKGSAKAADNASTGSTTGSTKAPRAKAGGKAIDANAGKSAPVGRPRRKASAGSEGGGSGS